MPYLKPDGQAALLWRHGDTWVSWSEMANALGVELRFDPPVQGAPFMHEKQEAELTDLLELHNRKPAEWAPGLPAGWELRRDVLPSGVVSYDLIDAGGKADQLLHVYASGGVFVEYVSIPAWEDGRDEMIEQDALRARAAMYAQVIADLGSS